MHHFLLYLFGLPLAALYGTALAVRHTLYGMGILRSRTFDFPVICVGNLAVGGTGKTPHTLLTAGILQNENIPFAILSRGYKRTSRGFRYVECASNAAEAGDEPLLIKRRLPNAVVAVCRRRVQAIRRIRRDHPEVQAVLLDDAFQYRRLNAGLSLLLTPYSRPLMRDALMPIGRLRDLKHRRHKAEIVITTQCPPALQPIEFKILQKDLKLYPYQRIYCTSYRHLPPLRLADGAELMAQGSPIIAMAGIARPQPFVEYLKQHCKVAQTLIFPDHHRFGRQSVQKIRQALHRTPNAVIITTEKDAVRLLNCGLNEEEIGRIAYLPIEVEFLREEDKLNFYQNILNYVKSNKNIGLFC